MSFTQTMILRYLWILKIKEKLKEKKNQVNIIIRTDFFLKNNGAANIVKKTTKTTISVLHIILRFFLNNEFIWATWSRK